MVIILTLVIIWYMVNNSFQIVYCHVNNSLTHVPILCHMNPVHSVPSHVSKYVLILYYLLLGLSCCLFLQACLCQEL